MSETQQQKSLSIMKSTLSRLPLYYYYIQDRSLEGQPYISSSALAEHLKLNPIQVRKDLASVSSVPGKSKVGFQTSQLLHDIKSCLGYDNYDEAVLVGVGSLGQTLMLYDGFRHYGLSIIAGFDSDPALHGQKIKNCPILPASDLTIFIMRTHIKLGIIAVPAAEAQRVADQMVRGGIRAIWNFAPTVLTLPEGILLKNENLAASLAILSSQLRNSEQ